MTPLNSPLTPYHEENPVSNVEEGNWALAGQSQPLSDTTHPVTMPSADNPYPAAVPSGEDISPDQHGILTQGVAVAPAAPSLSHPVADTLEAIGDIMEIVFDILDSFGK